MMYDMRTQCWATIWLTGVMLAALSVGCGDGESPADTLDAGAAADADARSVDDAAVQDDAGDAGGYAWKLPKGFPVPSVPADNPMTEEKVQLGRHLFYDKRLSGNGTQSCASCHEQKKAFADGRAVGLGSTGESHTRGSMSLANVAYASALTWANPLQTTLENQALVPLFGKTPVELGLADKELELLAVLKADTTYQQLFADAFGDDDDVYSVLNVTRAIACFERTLISGTSPYDRWANEGDDSAISEAAKRGAAMVLSDPTERFECRHCHGGFALAASVNHQGVVAGTQQFFNNGLYNIGGTGAYPSNNEGVKSVTNDPLDMGKFKPPTLRNIALTAPYMHDGSIEDLSGIIDHYAAGGRTIRSGPYVGDGSANTHKSPLLLGFILGGSERADLLAFLQSLTDDAFITNRDHENPWPAGSPAHGLSPTP
jgi:cytochrome c peroxidase